MDNAIAVDTVKTLFNPIYRHQVLNSFLCKNPGIGEIIPTGHFPIYTMWYRETVLCGNISHILLESHRLALPWPVLVSPDQKAAKCAREFVSQS